LAPLVYIVTDVIAGLRYPDYSFTAQAVSELFAIGAPTVQNRTRVEAVKEKRASDLSVDSRMPLRHVNTLDQPRTAVV
jgi:hypothetical protein